MTNYIINKEVEDELSDLHNGLHHVMENLVNRKDYDEAERLLRIIDSRLSHLINRARVAH